MRASIQDEVWSERDVIARSVGLPSGIEPALPAHLQFPAALWGTLCLFSLTFLTVALAVGQYAILKPPPHPATSLFAGCLFTGALVSTFRLWRTSARAHNVALDKHRHLNAVLHNKLATVVEQRLGVRFAAAQKASATALESWRADRAKAFKDWQGRRQRMADLAKQRDAFNMFLEALSPSDFEEFIADMLSAQGASNVDLCGRSGDGGIDVIAVFRSHHAIVQCKRYSKQGKVGEPCLRELLGAAAAYERRVGVKAKPVFAVTFAQLSKAAIKFASDNSISVWSCADIYRNAKDSSVFDRAPKWIEVFGRLDV